MKPKRLVVVTWRDAWGGGHEEYKPEEIVHQPFIQRSCGFEIRSDKTGVTLAGCIDEDGAIHRTVFIPRANILRVQRVT